MPVGDAPPSDDPLIGRVLSERYRILRKIGEGGMGTVYQAEHALIGKKIALKVLFPELGRRTDLVARFLQEAKSASRIGHENVIDISDFGQSPEGTVYIAMEYLEGQDLGRVIRADGQIGWPRARPILMQIAKALRAAHEHGIIHRDMKPENIYLIQREGRQDFVKVLDFGIAKIISPDENSPRLTQAGMIFGTPEYMSPEQAQGQTPDHRVDIYAVGCLMYHMLTGEVPFHADSFMGILTKHMLEPPVPLRQRRPELDIAPEVEAVCLRALEKDRGKRWQDMDAFYRALGGAGTEPFEASGVYMNPILSGNQSQRTPAPLAPAPGSTGLKTEVLPGTDSAADDEQHPVARRSAGVKLGAVIAGVFAAAIIAVLVTFALRPSSKPPQVPPADTAATTAAPAPVPAAVPPQAAPIPAVTPPAPAQETQPAAPGAGARRTRRRAATEAKPAAEQPGEAPAPASPVQVPSTPAELKDPFNPL